MKKYLSLLIAILISFSLSVSVSADWKENTSGDKWYINSDGEKANGFTKIGDKYYYFDKNNNSYMKTGITLIKNNDKNFVYYFDKDGVMVTNSWVKIKDYRCYFGSNGKAYTGWKTIGDKTYYFGSRIISDNLASGIAAAQGYRIIGTKLYYFDSNGVLSDKEQDEVGEIPIFWLPLFDPYENSSSTLSVTLLKDFGISYEQAEDDLFIDTKLTNKIGDQKLYMPIAGITLYRQNYELIYGFTSEKLSSVYFAASFETSDSAVENFAEMNYILTKAFGETQLKDSGSLSITCPFLTDRETKKLVTLKSQAYKTWTNGDTVIRMDLIPYVDTYYDYFEDDYDYVVQVKFTKKS
jgi:hypothetical protein